VHDIMSRASDIFDDDGDGILETGETVSSYKG
jgi:hypothetical protein